MKNFIKRNQAQSTNLEISEAQILDSNQSTRIKYPRHINQRVSFNHRNYGAIFRSNVAIPKTCSISNLNSCDKALTILQYQLKDETVKKAHLENVKRNLERRLQAAKAKGNNHLINLLQQEFQALEFS